MKRLLACVALACVASGCSTTFDLGSNDAGIPYDADCKPGIYSGTYSCAPTPGSLFQLPASGVIKITLVPSGARTLALTPDASLSSVSTGTTFTSELSGVLDCSTRRFTGTTGSVMILSPSFRGSVSGTTGTFDAVYNDDAGTPMLDDGTVVPLAVVAATCSWTAKLE
jgi:hypothetical protein